MFKSCHFNLLHLNFVYHTNKALYNKSSRQSCIRWLWHGETLFIQFLYFKFSLWQSAANWEFFVLFWKKKKLFGMGLGPFNGPKFTRRKSLEIELKYYTCVFLVTRPFCWYMYQFFLLHGLAHDFWPTFEKLNLDHNFWTKGDRAFISHMCISCGKTFLLEPTFFTSWPWHLTYFWKNLTLTMNF